MIAFGERTKSGPLVHQVLIGLTDQGGELRGLAGRAGMTGDEPRQLNDSIRKLHNRSVDPAPEGGG